jgi:hypothetical protein
VESAAVGCSDCADGGSGGAADSTSGSRADSGAAGRDASATFEPDATSPSPPDGGPDDSAPTADGGDDAPAVSDAPTLEDATGASDAAPAVDAPATWCTGDTAAFCADFDTTPLPSGFSTWDGTLLSLATDVPSSPPNALLLSVPPSSGTVTFASKLTSGIGAVVAGITVTFDLRPDQVSMSPLLIKALDFVGNPSQMYSVRLVYNQGMTRVEESFFGTAGGAPDHPGAR